MFLTSDFSSTESNGSKQMTSSLFELETCLKSLLYIERI